MIFEFLPSEYKAEARRIYKSKIITLYAIGATFLFVVSIFFLLPSYMLVRSEKTAVIDETNILEQAMVDSKEAEARLYVSLAKSKISYAKDAINKKQFIEALARVMANDRSSIDITAITFERGETSNHITISGTADTRDELLSFKKVLESETFFSFVDLPVSNLAKNRDIDFSISISQAI